MRQELEEPRTLTQEEKGVQGLNSWSAEEGGGAEESSRGKPPPSLPGLGSPGVKGPGLLRPAHGPLRPGVRALQLQQKQRGGPARGRPGEGVGPGRGLQLQAP